jgi:CheY-like chemotaxis protein
MTPAHTNTRFVLLVEDDESMRTDLAFLIEKRGHKVETAADGEEGLEKLRARGEACVIILDLMMPVMDGWQMRAELLKDQNLAKIPVILLSGIADSQLAKSLSAVDYLTKPIDFDKLYRLVDVHC